MPSWLLSVRKSGSISHSFRLLFCAAIAVPSIIAVGACCRANQKALTDNYPLKVSPQSDYVHTGQHCRVSMRIARTDEKYVYLAIEIENLGRKDLTLYNPFFHPIRDTLCVDSQSSALVVFDEDGRELFDLFDRSSGGSRVAGIAESWVVLRVGESWVGGYAIPRKRNASRNYYVQAIFWDRFVSSHPFGRPAWPIDGDFSLEAMREIRTFIGLSDPRVKAWRKAYTGRELFRSNAVVIPKDVQILEAGILAVEPVEAAKR